MHRGYIKLWRCIQDNPLWQNHPYSPAQAWLDIVLSATHKDRVVTIRGIDLLVKRGQCSESELNFAKKWKWSRNKVRKFLRKTEHEKMIKIEQQNIKLTSIITIENYELYQNNDTTEGTTNGTSKGTTEGHVVAIGPMAFKESPEPWCEIGDCVQVYKHSGVLLDLDDDEYSYRMVQDLDIQAVFPSERVKL